MKITKQEFDSLFNDNITKKEYDIIIEKINQRVDEICEKFLHETNRHMSCWYAYDNSCDGYDGFFDPKKYKENIKFTCENMKPPEVYQHGYYTQFPTRWLWENTWETEMNDNITKCKEKQIKEKQEQKEQKEKHLKEINALKQSIKNKLTREEFKIIKFV